MRLPDPQRSYAVLIGTSSYRSAELADLPAVANNLDGLADVLTDPNRGALPAERCVVLHNPTDVRTAYHTLDRHARHHHATDTLLVYFSGHGLLDPERHELYLALPDTSRHDLLVSAFRFDLIRRIFLDSRATNRVLILDCCFSGRAATPHMSDADEAILGQIDIEGTYILTATPANETALAPPGAPYTAFTGELLTLARTGIPDGPELLTLATFYRHLLRTLTARGLPRPQQRNTGTADHLALTRNPAHGPQTDQTKTKSRTRQSPRAPRTSRLLTATPITAIPTKVVSALAFSPDGQSLAVATSTNKVQIFDTATWRQRLALRQHWLGIASVFTVAFGGVSNQLATSGSDSAGGLVQMWDARTGRRWHKVAHSATVRAIAFDPGGGWLATGDSNGGVQIRDGRSGKPLIRVAHSDQVDGVAFSPDRRRLTTGSRDRTARIWDVHTGERKAVLAHDYPVRAVAFSPDGRLLATASTPARIWDAHTGTELLTLSPHPGSSTLSGRLCHDVAFSPNGRFLAAAYVDHTARIWDTLTGAELLKLSHDHEVRAVVFSPDGQWLATGDGLWQDTIRAGPGTVHVWQLKET